MKTTMQSKMIITWIRRTTAFKTYFKLWEQKDVSWKDI